MTDRPILFSPAMVQALLDGRKTQTRRILNPQPDPNAPIGGAELVLGEWWAWLNGYDGSIIGDCKTAHAVDDRLWVREAWKSDRAYDDLKPSEMGGEEPLIYLADDTVQRWGWKPDALSRWGRYRPGMFMPRWASRLTLTVTDVRVQRLQDISAADAIAEGITGLVDGAGEMHFGCYGPECPTDAIRSCNNHGCWAPREYFKDLWNGINDARGFGWDANPWVAAYTFTTEKRNIDQ